MNNFDISYYTILTLYCQEYNVKNIFTSLTLYAKLYIVKNGGVIMSIKLNIKDLVDAKGFSKHHFSQLIQVGYPATCKLYDGGTDRIYFDTLERICKVLECTPNDLFVSDDPELKRLLAYQSKLSKLSNNE
jgi:putative transcriptional regulator